jgi:hypothetical protein
MKKHWFRRILLLSVLCLLLLLPAVALSQGDGESLGWGTARIDGVLEDREWEPATRLTLTGREVFWVHGEGDRPPKPPWPDVETGVLLLMNDATHLFVGIHASFDDFTANPDDWNAYSQVCFSDEPDRWDDEWAAECCGDETAHEGCYMTGWGDEPEYPQLYFVPGIQEDCWGEFCDWWPMGQGVEVAGEAAETFSWEFAIDLEGSYLDKIEFGECFPLAVGGAGWSWRPEWQENGKWFGPGARGEFQWPEMWFGADCLPDPFASVCLHPNPYDPCEPPSAINDYIQNLPESAFQGPALQRMTALENKLLHDPDSVAKLIQAGEMQDAIGKLKNDIRAKLDGSLGGNPENDWITDATAQQELADEIDCLVAYLETLL